MGFGKNNVLPGNHFRKNWQRHVKTWFDQPGRKLRRRNARKAKAATLGVRPLTLLRPAVRGQTVRYNTKVREGRGFTLGELKEAGVSRKVALGLGIVVDHRRRNLSVEGKAINVERLKAYKERLVVFPRKAGKPKKGDSSVSYLLVVLCLRTHNNQKKNHPQPDDLKAPTTRQPLPLPPSSVPEQPRKITQEEREFNAYKTLRNYRAEARFEGARKIRAAKVSHSPLLLVRLLRSYYGFLEGGRGGSQEEVVSCSFPITSILCPFCMHYKTWATPRPHKTCPHAHSSSGLRLRMCLLWYDKHKELGLCPASQFVGNG